MTAKDPLTSTTWRWKKVKIRPSAAGHERSSRTKAGFLRLGPWPRKRPLTLTVLYRGGGESWWLIRARGEQQVFPGHLALEDVLARVMGER